MLNIPSSRYLYSFHASKNELKENNRKEKRKKINKYKEKLAYLYFSWILNYLVLKVYQFCHCIRRVSIHQWRVSRGLFWTDLDYRKGTIQGHYTVGQTGYYTIVVPRSAAKSRGFKCMSFKAMYLALNLFIHMQQVPCFYEGDIWFNYPTMMCLM